MGEKTLDLQQMKVLTNKKEETPFIQFPNTPLIALCNQRGGGEAGGQFCPFQSY
jgi:hypothetical protein